MSRNGYQPIETRDHDVEMTSMNREEAVRARAADGPKFMSTKVIGATIVAVLLVVILSFSVTYFRDAASTGGLEGGDANFDESGRFILKSFDRAKPMSDFLNGLGGLWGVPMWAFYVNRGQALTSFGVKNKDGEIEKFVTAEKAYQQTAFTGFRTFVKGSRSGEGSFRHQPFFPQGVGKEKIVSRDMKIGQNDLELEEVHSELGLQTNIVYYTAPNQDFPALVRKVTFKNLDSKQELKLEVLDGLSRLVPAGLSNPALDSMGRTSEAWMRVYNVGKASEGGARVTQPFFHITQSTADTAQVNLIKDGYFSLAYVDGGAELKSSGNNAKRDTLGLYNPLPYIVDPTVIYGQDTSLLEPTNFFAEEAPAMDDFVEQPQGTTARTPCAFSGATLTIAPGKSATITSVYGHAADMQTFVGTYSPSVRVPGYTDAKRLVGQEIVENITHNVATTSESIIFDQYVRQDYLDNTLRGGLPLPLGDKKNPKVFHTYSRIHGDIERDYNNFDLDTTYFSQGPGNFRDVSQNRRLDVLLSPFVGDFNVRMFLSFVQADGYNPLTVASTNFKVPEDKISSVVKSLQVKESHGVSEAAVTDILKKPFRPGQFFQDCANAGVQFEIPNEDVLNKVVAAATQEFAAKFAQNAFWADHWTYTLDLVHNYLSVYPDQDAQLLWDSEPVPFFLSPAFVLPRAERYSIVDNPNKPGTNTIRVYKSITVWGEDTFPLALNDALLEILNDPEYIGDATGAGGVWMRDKHGKVFTVSVVAKLLMLGTIKFSTMDPYGMGVEMEGGKPGWNDAMNGLPGILGSGMPETYEMLKVLQFVRNALKKHQRAVHVPVEYASFLTQLDTALQQYNKAVPKSKAITNDAEVIAAEFNFWNASNTAREFYRGDTMAKFSGEYSKLSSSYLADLLGSMEHKVEAGIARALSSNDGFSPTYFFYECTEMRMLPVTEVTDPPQSTRVEARAFQQHGLPLFLEGPTRHMKVLSSKSAKRDVYQRTRDSDLYDSALQMYTLSASLKEMGSDVGRMVGFSPGWLENQSVWLHMSYKFYLELLRGGLYDEFFAEIKTGLVPFMDPQVYGRSTLEAASFIVSSAFPDKSLHGTGFLARLSGSTAEFLSMWAIMMAGETPFTVDSKGALQLQFKPVLPGWLFPEDGEVRFTFLGAVEVIYKNPSRADTWKLTPQSGSVLDAEGKTHTVVDGVFGEELAAKVRRLEVTSITIDFGTASTTSASVSD